MKTAHVLRYAAIGMATIGLATTVAAATSVTVDTTGQGSSVDVTTKNINKATIENENQVHVDNDVSNESTSGNIHANENTTTGDISTGNTSSSSTTSSSVTLGSGNGDLGGFFNNGSNGSTTVDATKTGSESELNVTNKNINKLTVTNENNVTVNNDVSNESKSGSVTANENTSTGDISTGSASSSSNTSTSLSL